MEFKGTPTPWEVREGNGLLFVESSKEILGTPYGQEILADDYHNEDWKAHDVKLVAAAPKLLNAVQYAIIGLEWKFENQPMEFDKADGEKLEEWKELINQIL